MNKYMMMTAAAILGGGTASIAEAHSGSQAVYLTGTGTSGTGITYCNEVTLHWAGTVFSQTDSLADCNNGYTGAVGVGEGLEGTIKGIGKAVVISDSIAPYYLQLNEAINITYSYPITNGGTWTEWKSTDGLTSKGYPGGHYWFGVPPKKLGRQLSLQEAFIRRGEKKSANGTGQN